MALFFDISRWNIFSDYELLGQRTVGGFIKASEGTWPDKLFTTHWTETQEEGLWRGAYHFWRPEQNPKAQAKKFFDTVQGTGDLGELPPVLDVEMYGKASNVLACLKEIKKLFGKRPIIYTAQGIWNTFGNVTWAKNYPLWIANYLVRGSVRWSDDLAVTVKQKNPNLPKGWTKWTLWQFSQRGHGPDFGQDYTKSKQIDLNVFNGSMEQMRAFFGISDDDGDSGDEDIVQDPWTAEPLPPVGRKIQVMVPALRLRNAPVIMSGNDKDVMHRGDRTIITNARKDNNYIWCETGYRQ
ncbi:MAG: glycoside hydrolase family 25 protein, partial [Anaerolineales bacterium]